MVGQNRILIFVTADWVVGFLVAPLVGPNSSFLTRAFGFFITFFFSLAADLQVERNSYDLTVVFEPICHTTILVSLRLLCIVVLFLFRQPLGFGVHGSIDSFFLIDGVAPGMKIFFMIVD